MSNQPPADRDDQPAGATRPAREAGKQTTASADRDDHVIRGYN